VLLHLLLFINLLHVFQSSSYAKILNEVEVLNFKSVFFYYSSDTDIVNTVES